jgi:hypothetical protein
MITRYCRILGVILDIRCNDENKHIMINTEAHFRKISVIHVFVKQKHHHQMKQAQDVIECWLLQVVSRRAYASWPSKSVKIIACHVSSSILYIPFIEWQKREKLGHSCAMENFFLTLIWFCLTIITCYVAIGHLITTPTSGRVSMYSISYVICIVQRVKKPFRPFK